MMMTAKAPLSCRLAKWVLCAFLTSLLSRSAAEEILYEQQVRAQSVPIIVPVNCDGEMIPMMLDTGASVNFVDASMQAHLHNYVGEKTAVAAGSNMRVKLWDSPAMILGQWKLPESLVTAIDLATPRSTVGLDLRGVLGRTALEEVALEVNFDEGEVRFIRDYDPPNATILLKPGGTLTGMNYVPMDLDAMGNPCLRMEINGIIMRVMIDTGGISDFQLRTETFNKLVAAGAVVRGPASDDVKNATAAGIVTNHTGKFTKGSFLGVDLAGISVEDSGMIDGVGWLFLLHFNFVYDIAGRRFCFQLRHGEPPIDYYAMIGAGLIFSEGHCQVYSIKPGPAQEIGLQKDDEILAFGPLRGKELNKPSISELCGTRAGQTVDVEYTRAGKGKVFKGQIKLPEKRFLFPSQP